MPAKRRTVKKCTRKAASLGGMSARDGRGEVAECQTEFAVHLFWCVCVCAGFKSTVFEQMSDGAGGWEESECQTEFVVHSGWCR